MGGGEGGVLEGFEVRLINCLRDKTSVERPYYRRPAGDIVECDRGRPADDNPTFCTIADGAFWIDRYVFCPGVH